MGRSGSSVRVVALFAALFLLGGLLHVLLYGVPFTNVFTQLYCGAMVALWAMSVQRRVKDARLRRWLLMTAGFLLLYNLLQIVRYRLCGVDPDFSRVLWYAFYIPMIAAPLLCFLTALCVRRPDQTPLPRWCAPLVAFGVLLAVGVLTNDVHFFAFRFPTGVLDDNGDERRNWLYVVCCAWIGLLMLLTLIVTARKCRGTVRVRLRLLTAAPMLGMGLLLGLSIMGIRPRLKGVDLWRDGQIFCFGVLGFLESCIRIGLIPANKDYERLFALAELPAVIVNDAGEPVYQTASAQYPFPKDEDALEQEHAIGGGSIRWLTDIGTLQALNGSLEDTIQQINARNAYLAEENRIRQERAELETRNRLYDSVSRIVRPQLDQIAARIDGDGAKTDLEAQLGQIAVLCAYVKRRSNMELLASDGLTLDELAAAIRESLENLQLCGAATALRVAGQGDYPSGLIVAAYEHFEAIVEACVDTLSDLLVVLRAQADRLTLRMLIRADAIEYAAQPHPEDEGFARQLTVSNDNRDTVVTLTLVKGGEAA